MHQAVPPSYTGSTGDAEQVMDPQPDLVAPPPALQTQAAGADATPVRSVVRPRLTDTYTDTVLDGMGDLCRLLDRASPAFWQQLAAAGTALRAHPSSDLDHCVQIALASNRAALLTYALELLDQQIAVTLAAHPDSARQTLEPARLPLAAAVSVMVLADLLDPATYTRLTAPLAGDLLL